jgi:hypothetical protein
MIEDLDEVLRQFLIRELPIRNGEVDVAFDQPSREWSARVSRPTLSLFLYDLRENRKLRQAQPMWEVVPSEGNSVTRRRRPVRADMHYMITAWASEPEDEHRLLSRTWMAFLRHPHLPPDLLPDSLQDQPVPIPVVVAQYDELHNATDIWNVLDNEMRPAIACTLTLALDPYTPIATPLVRVHELRIGTSPRPLLERLDEHVEPDRFWTIGGYVRSERPLDLERVRLTLVERDLDIALREGGRFVIGPVQAGDYTLEVVENGGAPRQFKIAIPAADYELEL